MTDSDESILKRAWKLKPRNIFVHITSLFVILYFFGTLIQQFLITNGINLHPALTIFVSSAIIYGGVITLSMLLVWILESRGY